MAEIINEKDLLQKTSKVIKWIAKLAKPIIEEAVKDSLKYYVEKEVNRRLTK